MLSTESDMIMREAAMMCSRCEWLHNIASMIGSMIPSLMPKQMSCADELCIKCCYLVSTIVQLPFVEEV